MARRILRLKGNYTIYLFGILSLLPELQILTLMQKGWAPRIQDNRYSLCLNFYHTECLLPPTDCVRSVAYEGRSSVEERLYSSLHATRPGQTLWTRVDARECRSCGAGAAFPMSL